MIRLSRISDYGIEIVEDPARGDGGDLRVESECLATGVYDVQPLEAENVERRPRGARQGRRRRPLELEAPASPASHPQAVDLRAGVRGPEEALLRRRAEVLQDLLKQEALP